MYIDKKTLIIIEIRNGKATSPNLSGYTVVGNETNKILSIIQADLPKYLEQRYKDGMQLREFQVELIEPFEIEYTNIVTTRSIFYFLVIEKNAQYEFEFDGIVF